MIEVEHLTKRFGEVVAIEDVSFRLEKGKILGFLGPNGAGKTTTMRILTGYFPASSGTARLAGFDIFEDSIEVRRRVGYLPELPPLYQDMSVVSYLKFVLKIREVSRADRKKALERVLFQCAIDSVADRLIATLSKGFKQRVGLAQAMIHDPEILILDEPTIGLDPKQIIEIRKLIKGLKGKHTVILSTHILPEVTMTCDEVLIINEGRVALQQEQEVLTSKESLEEVFLRITTKEEVLPDGEEKEGGEGYGEGSSS